MGVLVHGHEAVACSSGHMRGGTCDMLLIRPAHLSASSSGHEAMHAPPARRMPSRSASMHGDSRAAAAASVATTGCIAAAIVLLQESCTRAGLGAQRSCCPTWARFGAQPTAAGVRNGGHLGFGGRTSGPSLCAFRVWRAHVRAVTVCI